MLNMQALRLAARTNPTGEEGPVRARFMSKEKSRNYYTLHIASPAADC